ncbi:MAG: hypothetical protein ABIW76_21290 [Fibrobacteria bacterium]
MSAASPSRPASGIFYASAAALLAVLVAIPVRGAAIKEAAGFYHQGLFDSSLACLKAVKAEGHLKHRDSLSLFQYLGMASARLGREPEAVGHFGSLLGLDSLFQFPRNEDSAVLRAFSRARERRTAPLADAAPGQDTLKPQPLPAAPLKNGSGPGILLASSSPSSAPTSPSSTSADIGIPLTGPNPPDTPALRKPPPIGFTMGALPLGAGWFARDKVKHGLVLGLLQAGGIALSIYASDRQSREQRDIFQVQNRDEAADLEKWQLVQRVSLSTAVGAYLFSLIAASGDR